MKFFNNLFGKRNSESLPQNHKDHTEIPEINEVPRELFISEEAPDDFDIAEFKTNTIRDFLDRNWNSKGQSDGFLKHSKEVLEFGKKRIAVDFRMKIAELIDSQHSQEVEIRKEKMKIKGLSESIEMQLAIRLEDITQKISELNLQNQLSVDNEGWVSTCLIAYEEGFLQGLEEHIESQSFMNPINNL